jgi:hypothetical protein
MSQLSNWSLTCVSPPWPSDSPAQAEATARSSANGTKSKHLTSMESWSQQLPIPAGGQAGKQASWRRRLQEGREDTDGRARRGGAAVAVRGSGQGGAHRYSREGGLHTPTQIHTHARTQRDSECVRVHTRALCVCVCEGERSGGGSGWRWFWRTSASAALLARPSCTAPPPWLAFIRRWLA